MSDEDFNEIINSLEDESVLFIRTHGLAVRRDQIVYVKKETTLSE